MSYLISNGEGYLIALSLIVCIIVSFAFGYIVAKDSLNTREEKNE